MSESEAAADTEEAIMEAMYSALCKHGYAGTTISAIADEFEKSKSLLYYHYEDKEALLNDFLRFMLGEIETSLDDADAETPRERLYAIIDLLLPPDLTEEEIQFRRALLETRANAPHSSTYHDQFEHSDEVILTRMTESIEYGIEAGDFEPVDPEETAEFIYATIYGGLERGVTLDDDEVLERTRAALENYLDSTLFRDD
jgi:AcrR family transcriptional regulator